MITIDKRPSDNDTHTWADYIELLAIINPDNICTVDAAVDRVRDIAHDDELRKPEAEANTDEDDVGSEGVEPISNRTKKARARDRTTVTDAFYLSAWRSNAYGAFYPFTLDQGRSVTLKDVLTSSHHLYIFLLISANLRFIRKQSGQKALVDNFEEVAKQIMQHVLPSKAEVHLFGKATASKYSGTAYEKIRGLCRDIRANLIASEEHFRDNDSGDSGIDIVGWHGLSDQQKNIIVYFGQCACSRTEWKNKQLSVHRSQLASIFQTTSEWVTMMFIPICFRKVGGDWAFATDIASVVLMDRLRLVRNCLDIDSGIVTLAIKGIVESGCSTKEPIV